MRAIAVILLALAVPASAGDAPVESPEAMIHRLCKDGCAFMSDSDAEKMQANIEAMRATVRRIERERAAEKEARKSERCS